MGSPLSRVADALSRVSARWVPDAFSIALTLTFVTLALGMVVSGVTPRQCVSAWGGSLWALLPFSMQIALVIFLGYVLAVISIRGSQKGATAVAVLVPLLSFGLPIMDVLMAVF